MDDDAPGASPVSKVIEYEKYSDCTEALLRGPSLPGDLLTRMVSQCTLVDSSNHNATIEDAWENLRCSLIYFHGRPIGCIAALDSNVEAINYNQVFVRDFVPATLAFMMNDEHEIVKNFLLKTLCLQGWEK
ncbi:hypothetical protein SUGI_0554080 [Cryptomeria japonica]|nr:hypothetical protein SUGI_0554080 [Cryptomeria japonica]